MIQKFDNTQQVVHLYEKLDYLVTPARSRIDTGVYATTDITAEMTVNFTNTISGNPRLFSTHDSVWNSPGTWGISIENVNIPVVFPLGYHGNFPVNYAIQQNVDYRFRLEGSGLYTLYDSSDNVLSTQDFSSYTSSITSDTSIYLFFFRDSYEYITQDTKVYSCKIWDNGVLIKDYIPVKRLSDNKYGMYDNVSRTFHPNEISGYDFSGVSKSVPEYIDEQQSNATYVNDIKFNGSSINRIYLNGEVYWGNGHAPAPTATYEILESIITPSSALIDTLYTASENTVVEMIMKMPTIYGNQSKNYRIMTTYDPASADRNGYWGSPGTWGLQFETSSHLLSMAQLGRRNSVYNSTIRFSSLSGYKYRYVVTAKGICNIYDTNDTVVYSFDAGYTSGTVSQTTITLFGLKGVQTPIYDDTLAGNAFYGGKLWKSNVLLRDFVPVRRLSDNAIGLYDYVSRGFFGNLLSTTFSYVAKSTPEYI